MPYIFDLPKGFLIQGIYLAALQTLVTLNYILLVYNLTANKIDI